MTSHYERRQRKPLSHKPRGRKGSGNAKLDDTKREYMRKLHRTGKYTLKELADNFSVCYGTAQRVCSCSE